ncbi:hypothetical protein HU200_004825 [Digitaria exilis]|uniref:Glutathione S-transferase n=1 Tax=Digitaria exilis TaxID=1010633 RepID=A0A835FT55_9POAL|nr:hypothetical protein HU200_004825 [Digitaria exilis]
MSFRRLTLLKLFGSWVHTLRAAGAAAQGPGVPIRGGRRTSGTRATSCSATTPCLRRCPCSSTAVARSRSRTSSSSTPTTPGRSPAHSSPTPSTPRTLARFWCHFIDNKLGPAMGRAVFASTGEDQEAAVRQVHDNLALLEADLRNGTFRGPCFFDGDEVGLLDVVLGYGSYWLPMFKDVTGVRLMGADVLPRFHAGCATLRLPPRRCS